MPLFALNLKSVLQAGFKQKRGLVNVVYSISQSDFYAKSTAQIPNTNPHLQSDTNKQHKKEKNDKENLPRQQRYNND